MVLTIVMFGLILPFTPLAGPLKFAPRHCPACTSSSWQE